MSGNNRGMIVCFNLLIVLVHCMGIMHRRERVFQAMDFFCVGSLIFSRSLAPYIYLCWNNGGFGTPAGIGIASQALYFGAYFNHAL